MSSDFFACPEGTQLGVELVWVDLGRALAWRELIIIHNLFSKNFSIQFYIYVNHFYIRH